MAAGAAKLIITVTAAPVRTILFIVCSMFIIFIIIFIIIFFIPFRISMWPLLCGL
jgi:hypothetical protein